MNSPKANINNLTPQEARILRLYGRPPSQTHHFAKHLKERKYFDSGDYALSKAGRADSAVGSLHPAPRDIPHPHPHRSHSHSHLHPPHLHHHASTTATATITSSSGSNTQ